MGVKKGMQEWWGIKAVKIEFSRWNWLVQVMAWYLRVPSHYLSQCWVRNLILYLLNVLAETWILFVFFVITQQWNITSCSDLHARKKMSFLFHKVKCHSCWLPGNARSHFLPNSPASAQECLIPLQNMHLNVELSFCKQHACEANILDNSCLPRQFLHSIHDIDVLHDYGCCYWCSVV